MGDLWGVVEKIDYLKELGINGIWITPFFESPLVDEGYDISNHKSINPIYGDMKTFDLMMEKCK